MPIYEYLCKDCDSEFEIMQKFSEAPKKKCPSCGGKIAKKLSMSSFHLKGTGWYKTDYAKSETEKKSKKKENTTSSNSSTASAPPASKEKASESKA